MLKRVLTPSIFILFCLVVVSSFYFAMVQAFAAKRNENLCSGSMYTDVFYDKAHDVWFALASSSGSAMSFAEIGGFCSGWYDFDATAGDAPPGNASDYYVDGFSTGTGAAVASHTPTDLTAESKFAISANYYALIDGTWVHIFYDVKNGRDSSP